MNKRQNQSTITSLNRRLNQTFATPDTPFLTISIQDGLHDPSLDSHKSFARKFIDLSIHPRSSFNNRSIEPISSSHRRRASGWVKPVTFFMDSSVNTMKPVVVLNKEYGYEDKKTPARINIKKALMRAQIEQKYGKMQESNQRTWKGVLDNIRSSLQTHLKNKYYRNVVTFKRSHTKNVEEESGKKQNVEYSKNQQKSYPVPATNKKPQPSSSRTKVAKRYCRNGEGNAKYAATIFSNAKLSRTLQRFADNPGEYK